MCALHNRLRNCCVSNHLIGNSGREWLRRSNASQRFQNGRFNFLIIFFSDWELVFEVEGHLWLYHWKASVAIGYSDNSCLQVSNPITQTLSIYILYSIVFHIRWISSPWFSVCQHWAKCETETPIDVGHFAAEFMRVHEEGPPTYDKYLERISISVCVVHARRFEDCAFDRYTLPQKQRSSCCAMYKIKFCIHAITCSVVWPKITRYQNILVSMCCSQFIVRQRLQFSICLLHIFSTSKFPTGAGVLISLSNAHSRWCRVAERSNVSLHL